MSQLITIILWSVFVYLVARAWHEAFPASLARLVAKLFPPHAP